MKGVLFGAPGVGKGTQGAFLSDLLSVPIISTGQVLREYISKGGPDAENFKSIIDSGQLIPDELIVDVAIDRVSMPDCENGYLFDGFPRTIVQAQCLEQLGISLDFMIEFKLDRESIVERISGRRVHVASGRTYHVIFDPPKQEGIDDETGEPLIIRNDDSIDAVNERLNVYEKKTAPLREYFAKLNEVSDICLMEVDASGTIESVRQRVIEAFNTSFPDLDL